MGNAATSDAIRSNQETPVAVPAPDVEALASALLSTANARARGDEVRKQRTMHELLSDPSGPLLAVLMADRTCRSESPVRIADAAAHLLEQLGTPRSFSLLERLGLQSVPVARHLLPSLIASSIRKRIAEQASGMLLDARPAPLSDYLHSRHDAGVRVNVNRLGEALVGEDEARRRVQAYCELARRSEVDAISVKISSICSQLSPLAFDWTCDTLAERLGTIYDAAGEETLVYLDMEAYEELDLTVASMQRALDDPSRAKVKAGIVVQAYLPDAHALLERLLNWSAKRAARGGAPLTLRFVKGANLATERVHSSLMGWALPIYPDKASVDASYRLLLQRVMQPEHASHVRIGVGSHNVFDLAYALTLSKARGVEHFTHIELLEGMADPLQRALRERDVPTLVYAPVVEPGSFQSAVAYLVRRLDENATDSNFLRRAFGMQPGNAAWSLEQARFREGLARMAGLSRVPRRHGAHYADRTRRPQSSPAQFENEPNTDFTTEANRRWIAQCMQTLRSAPAPVLSSVVAGEEGGERIVDGVDPSRPDHVPYRVRLASDAQVERAIQVAQEDPSRWSERSLSERAHVLRRVAGALREARGELIALMACDSGKAVMESDPEVSEVIDFAEYYHRSATELVRRTGAQLSPRGVVLVAAPWNFPLAIPIGGALAALMAGNRVLFKPAPQTPWVATRAAELCWQAGIPKHALQLLLCDDRQAAQLSADARVNAVVLTGATATARAIRKARPDVRLSAETGGKNALIVSAMSDREQAARDAVLGAFAHAGQKCSATSLLLCEAEVYDDPVFMETLRDAAASLPVGSPYAMHSVVTPLIEPPGEALARGLHQLEQGERWLLEPRQDPTNPLLYSPGVKLGVTPGNFTHMNELFGPVLSVMRVQDLDEAIDIAHQPGYGLTAGLHSLDDREHQHFIRRMRAGNLYINRTTTGAIVRRQSFGGMARSSFGPGAKAGGPNYVAQLAHVQAPALEPPAETLDGRSAPRLMRLLSGEAAEIVNRRRLDYAYWWQQTFAHAQDPSGLIGEDNLFRYLPCANVIIRGDDDTRLEDLASSCVAASLAGCQATLSLSPGLAARTQPESWGLSARVETAAALIARSPRAERLRLLTTASPEMWQWAVDHDVHVADEPVSDCGRFELLHYLREQAVCIRYHRHGHLGLRELEQAAPRPARGQA